MEKTWRWFGPSDRITLAMLRQVGVEGIVTSLHEIPAGTGWSIEAIEERKNLIESSGLRWSVVESLPVPESVKYAGPDRDVRIQNYCTSIRNLGKAGIRTVVYNFMPVIDWIRTDLNYKLPDGTHTLYFDKIRFAFFDCCILQRKNAENDYTAEELDKVYALKKSITPREIEELIEVIIVKTQGFVNDSFREVHADPVQLFKRLLSLYDGITKTQLRENLRYFLDRVILVAEEAGVNLCIHPDDPPMPVLGLPRIVSNAEDIEWILAANESSANGLTFCAGSLSAGLHNDVVKMAQQFAQRTHFLHLRSTHVETNGNFMESSHLEGRGRLVELIELFGRVNPGLPMRVDHGKLLLDDGEKKYNPGYSLLGRMMAFAQVEGMMAVIERKQG